MSHQSNTSTDSPANGPLGFLKEVVSNISNGDKNDSDKENDQRLMTISEEPSENSSLEQNSQSNFKQTENSRIFETPLNSAMAKDEEKDMWDDFYNEEDFRAKREDPIQVNGVLGPNNDSNLPDKGLAGDGVLEKVDEEKGEAQSLGDDYSDTFDSSIKEDENQADGGEGKEDDGDKQKKRKRKRLFKRRHPPPIVTTTQTTGGSHPNLGRHDNNHPNNQQETMSESGDAGARGRRLNRRKQVSRPRCAGPNPSGDVLQQKYQELEELVLKPLPNPGVYVKQTRQQMLRLRGLSTQYHTSNHNYNTGSHQVVEGLPPPSGNPRQNQNEIVVEEVTEEGYSTIRTLQVVQRAQNSSSSTRQNRPKTAHPSRRPLSGQRQLRPASAGRGRPMSANNKPNDNLDTSVSISQSTRGRGTHRVNRGRSSSGGRGGGKGGRRSDSESKDHSSRDSRDSRDSRNQSSDHQSRSNSQSPSRVIQHTETRLENSGNPALQQWLKAKNKQLRQYKKEERKKKREERAEKQEIERKKQESLQDSEKKVKEWMTKKRKEAWRKAKEDRKRAQGEREMIEQRESQYGGPLRGHSIERPRSAPAHGERKTFIPVIRPDGDQASNKDARQQINGEIEIPTPPKSKFVYKRPVSGRVRLMKLQQERKEDAKKQEMRKKEMEKLTEEEKNRKMRMSYDQWLLKKRQEDYEKRQLAARQRALAKSDPELDRIVPEMARRRIENIQRGKRRIQTNMESVDEKVNRSFGGGDFGSDDVGHGDGTPVESPSLHVSGQKKSLGKRPSSAKPASSNSLLNPQKSRSPRRPKSAHPRVQSIMNSSEDEERVVDAKAFQLPFPPELGVPKYVAQRQDKLFSQHVIERASENTLSVSLDATDKSESCTHSEKMEAVMTEPNSATTSEQVTEEKEATQGTEQKESEVVGSFFVTDGCINDIEEMEAEKDYESADITFKDHGHVNDDEDHEKYEIGDNVDEIEMEYEDEFEEIEKKESEEEQNNDEQVQSEFAVNEGENNATPSDGANVKIYKNDEETKEHKPCLMDEQIPDGEKASTEPEAEKTRSPEPLVEEMKEEGEKEYVQEEQKQEEEEEDKFDEEEPKSEASEGRSSVKHVSFVEEAVIHEDPLAGISPQDYDYDTDENVDEAEDERGAYFGEDSPRTDEAFWYGEDDKLVDEEEDLEF